MSTITLASNPVRYAKFAGEAKGMETRAWAAWEEDDKYLDLNETDDQILLFESQRTPGEYTEHTTQVTGSPDKGPVTYSRESRYQKDDNAGVGFHESFKDTEEGRVYTSFRKTRNPSPTVYMVSNDTITILED